MRYVKTFAAVLAAVALASCGQTTATAPPAPEAAPAAPAPAAVNVAPLAYLISQHSPLLDAAARTAISQDFNGAPLSGPRAQHEVNAERVACRTSNPPTGAPECSATYAAANGSGQEVAIEGEDAAALFEALASAGARDDAGMGHIVRELTAVRCTVDDAAAQDTPATGDQVAGFACTFTQP